jgi:alpha-1,3/alpha-1,6-mannosyltransferase
MRIAFLHPELGIGGAERLMLEAARALQEAGHEVAFLTARMHPEHSVAERGGLEIGLHGSRIPRTLGQRLRAPLSVARMAALARAPELRGEGFDVVVCDLVAHAIPYLRRRTRAAIVFYCHFPDALLVPRARGVYRGYRAVLDRMEGAGLAAADRVLTNSRFTAQAVLGAHPRHTIEPEVVYPGVEIPAAPAFASLRNGDPIRLMTLSRLVPEKRLDLAVRAFAALRERVPRRLFARIRLVVAGAYDSSLRECRLTRDLLVARAREAGIAEQVSLELTPSEPRRAELLREAYCLLHPAGAEHLGLAPLEAMAAGRPVVATAAGGLLETVVDGETGYLRPPGAEAFADALADLVARPERAESLGRAARARVERHFSRECFRRRLEGALQDARAAGARVRQARA